MIKLKFKEQVKWRFEIQDDKIELLEELVVDILQRLDERAESTPKKPRKKK